MEAVFFVWSGAARAKAEAVVTAAGAARTNDDAPPAQGRDSEGLADFRSELSAKLQAAANGGLTRGLPDGPRVLAGDPGALPDALRVLPEAPEAPVVTAGSAAPEAAVREGAGIGTGADSDVNTHPGEVNEHCGQSREKRNSEADRHADACPAPFLVAAKDLPAVAQGCAIEGSRAVEPATETSTAAAAPEDRRPSPITPPAAGVEGRPHQGRMTTHLTPKAAPSPGIETGGTAKATRQGCVAAAEEEVDPRLTEEPDTDRMAAPRSTGGTETSSAEGRAARGTSIVGHGREVMVPSGVPGGARSAPPYERREGGARMRVRGQDAMSPGDGLREIPRAEEARLEDAPAPGERRVQCARGEDGPSVATADGRAGAETGRATASARGGWPATPVDRDGTGRRAVAQESGRVPGEDTGPGLRESDAGAANPGRAEGVSRGTGDSRAHEQGQALGIEVEIVERAETGAMVASSGKGDARSAVRVQAEDATDTTAAGPRSQDSVLSDVHPQEQRSDAPMPESSAAASPGAHAVGSGDDPVGAGQDPNGTGCDPEVGAMATAVPGEDRSVPAGDENEMKALEHPLRAAAQGTETLPQPGERHQQGMQEERGRFPAEAERYAVAFLSDEHDGPLTTDARASSPGYAAAKGHGRYPALDASASPRERRGAGVEPGSGIPREHASRVERPAPEGGAVSRPRSGQERTAMTDGDRPAERDGRESASTRPATLTGVPDPRDVKVTRPLPVDSSAAQERQAPVTARSVIDQIVQRAQLRLGRSEAEMVIDLKPDALGRVHLRITAESGRVVAEIRAENAVTRQLIETGLPDLRTALADRGLDLGAIAVSGGFGSDVAWNGARSRGSEGDAGHGQARASPGGAGAGGIRRVGPSVAGGPSTTGVHLVDCVA